MNRQSTKCLIGPALGLIAGLGLSVPLQAQTAGAEASASKREKELGKDALDEVVVMARRVEERQLTVPITVNVLGGQDLDRLQIRSTEDLEYGIPAMKIDTSLPGGATFTIRGIGAHGTGAQGVTSYFAEVPQDMYGNATLLDLASIQVLKGPQGTLFGKNSIGGAVLFVPQRPKQEFEGYMGARAGNFSMRELTGAVNVPIAESLAVRFAGRYTHRDALTENISGHDIGTENRAAGRISVLWTPSEGFENYLIADGYTADEYGRVWQIVNDVGACPSSGGACLFDLIGAPLSEALAEQGTLGIDKVNQPRVGKDKYNLWGVTNSTQFNLGSVTLKNILGYRHLKRQQRVDFDGFRSGILYANTPGLDKQTTEELQLRGTAFGDRLSWLIGGFYADSKRDGLNNLTYVFYDVPFVPNPSILDSRLESKEKALFGQFTYDLASLVEGLKFTLGVRQSWEDRDFVGSSFGGLRTVAACTYIRDSQPLSGTDPLTCERSLSNDESEPTWNINLEYQISPTLFTYLTTRKGFKQGGFNPAAASETLTSYGPEKLKDIEVGLKFQGRIGDLPFRSSIAAYTANYKGFQSQQLVNDNGIVATFIQNVGDAKIDGVELEATLIPFAGFEVGGYYALTDGKYDNDVDLPEYAGKRLLMSAKQTAGLNVHFSRDLGDVLGTMTLSGNLKYTGMQPTSYNVNSVIPYERKYQQVGGFTTMDTTLEFQGVARSNVDLRLYVENVTDKRAPIFTIDLREALGYANRQYLEQRTYGIEAMYRFK